MKDNARTLFELLPAIHRIRDAETAEEQGLERGPLEELMAVLSEQIEIAEESLDQSYDDLFIETCADWVVPYIGDLIGYRSLHSVSSKVASPRAEVAHTIALRRRKGTALVLEQLARDVTGWDARAVEYFQRLCTTQYMNHPRLHNRQSPDLRKSAALEWVGTAFETANRTVDVRRIDSGRGRHNIPNVGLHLWRIQAYARSFTPAQRDGPRRYRASPLGHDLPLYNRPVAEDDITHLAEPDNVPWPFTRRRLADGLSRFYAERAQATAPIDNAHPSLVLWVNGNEIERGDIRICHLGDDGALWAHTPPANGTYAIDPVLGRIALPADAPDPAEVRLTWHEGFSADIGGGEYERGDTLPTPGEANTVVTVSASNPLEADFTDIASALVSIAGDGIIEITDNSRYSEALVIDVVTNGSVEIRARNGFRPVLDLSALSVTGAQNSSCALNGLLITGSALDVPDSGSNALDQLRLQHCTLVPGIGLNADGSAQQPGVPSLTISIAGLDVQIGRCILGGIRAHERAAVGLEDSLVDANDATLVAFAATDNASPGGALSIVASTVIGKIHTTEFGLVSNSILLATQAVGDTWAAPVRSARKQVGCVRFSWLPLESIVPARHRCQPESASTVATITPRFSSLRYGTPAYGQLTTSTPDPIRRGADDESEMGVLHHLYGSQRETNLRIRLAEYLRVGLRAGIFYES
jgi:hypothetical protein